jgi:hypothetical protein
VKIPFTGTIPARNNEEVGPVLENWTETVKSLPIWARLLVGIPEGLIGLACLVAVIPVGLITAYLGLRISAYSVSSMASALIIGLTAALITAGIFAVVGIKLIQRAKRIVEGRKTFTDEATDLTESSDLG